jgi:hypothetical protein
MVDLHDLVPSLILSIENFSTIPMDGANSPEKWFKELPPVTRYGLVALFASTCLASLGVLNPSLLTLDWQLVARKYDLDHVFFSTI